MENEKEMEGNEENMPTRPHYRYICSNSNVGFLNLLNKNAVEGYKIDRETLIQEKGVDKETGEVYMKREAYLYDTESLNPLELETDVEIIEALDAAEGYLIQTSTSLSDEKNRLLIDTDYDIVNAKRQKEGLPAIKTAPEKKAWVEQQVNQHALDAQEAKRWKHYVEAMAKKRQLPSRIPPWITEAEKADEEASKIEVEKVTNIGDITEDDIISPDMGKS